jgi:threonine synthase
MILADPVRSVLARRAGSWTVEGSGEDFVPPNADLSLIRQACAVSDQDSFATARDLLRHEGVLAGSSTRTLLAAALRYCRKQEQPAVVLAAGSAPPHCHDVDRSKLVRQRARCQHAAAMIAAGRGMATPEVITEGELLLKKS